MRILVTGGAGFVGSHLVDALIAQRHEVRVLDSLEPQVHGRERRPPDYLNRNAELQVGDVRDHSAVARALDGIEVVFHLAAAVGVGQSMYEMERYVSVNSVGAAVLLEGVAQRRERIRKLIVASSMSAYGEGSYRNEAGELVYPALRPEEQLRRRLWELRDEEQELLRPVPTSETKPLAPTSIYAITKRDQEEMCLSIGAAYRVPTVALRYFNIYGTRQSLSNPYTGVMAIFCSRLLSGKRPLIFEDGLQTRDFVHVSDIVQANLLALEKDQAAGCVYNVGTGEPTSVRRVAELLADEFGVREPPEVPEHFRAGDIRHCFADITKIRTALGYQPRVSLGEGLRQLLAWLRTQKAEDRVEEAHRELERRGLSQ
ncbi:MAG TPA: NAD-dependent epimerase/dehydratase family protein [Myxococcota bacterium]|nr:NAD-dependent epimerase/dehydratase family protein [Myxococcota bacterium]